MKSFQAAKSKYQGKLIRYRPAQTRLSQWEKISRRIQHVVPQLRIHEMFDTQLSVMCFGFLSSIFNQPASDHPIPAGFIDETCSTATEATVRNKSQNQIVKCYRSHVARLEQEMNKRYR